MLPLNSHHAASIQTGSLGDTAICFVGENPVITTYEMKMKRVTQDDIDAAVAKITRAPTRIHNCLFVTTDAINPMVTEYTATFCEKLAALRLSFLIASNVCSTFCTIPSHSKELPQRLSETGFRRARFICWPNVTRSISGIAPDCESSE